MTEQSPPEHAGERVLQFRSANARSEQQRAPVATEADKRLLDLEQQLDAQDRVLRRVLTLLVEWLESGRPPPGPWRHDG